MQQRFAEFLVFGGPDGPMTKREAAIAAGYSKDRAMREGSELTNPKYSPLVVKHIGELKEERLRTETRKRRRKQRRRRESEKQWEK